MQLSLTPILLIIELAFLFILAARSGRVSPMASHRMSIHFYLIWLTTYSIVTSLIGAAGLYVTDDLLRLFPGFWLQLITVAAVVAPVVLFDRVRQELRHIVDSTPMHWFAYFQALRITALGTTYKTVIGEFPLYFEILVGIPDLLFGLSAFWVAELTKRGKIGERGFMRWNLIGALIIVPSAPILLQLGLPGPLQVFTALPDARAAFTYPMSIAPMIGVPLFVLINLWVAWRLWERQEKNTAIGAQASSQS